MWKKTECFINSQFEALNVSHSSLFLISYKLISLDESSFEESLTDYQMNIKITTNQIRWKCFFIVKFSAKTCWTKWPVA